MSAQLKIVEKDVADAPTSDKMSDVEARLSREDKRELQKIRCELLTLAERVAALINRAAVKE